MRQMQKVKNKALAVSNTVDLSEKEKLKQIEKLYKGNMKKVKPSSVYVVRKKFQKGRSGIPNAQKGTKYKIVDPRLKKDKRARKSQEQTRAKRARNK